MSCLRLFGSPHGQFNTRKLRSNELIAKKSSPILDLCDYDIDCIVADKDEIRKYNRQRFAMEQIDAVVFEDGEQGICVGYKDVRHDEFWVAGHMPKMPIMPGVVMCEAAAQLASYVTIKHDLMGAEVVGLGGLDDVRIRGSVVPGDRLVIALQKTRVRRNALIVCQFQGYVSDQLVIEGKITGVRLA